MPVFSKLLVANRGEIACRVIASARAMGYATVAVFSDADADARHVALADEAIRIGPPPAAESYLDVEAILEAAKRTGADAVHPGYGFLAENEAFARACTQAGVVFVGPSPEAIAAMGDKAAAKAAMISAGVPCVPGYFAEDEAGQSDGKLLAAATDVGFPLLVKAVAGGGGRGMRRVDDASQLPDAISNARREATAAFGDGTLMLERLVTRSRHVEVQVIADEHGNVRHLGERDCSLQRRHQKVIEEAPSPAVDEALRDRMGAAAVEAARAIDYCGAGTVEFLLDREGSFYFLEMNTRLQVEHPVTELVTGLDLVELQLRVAAGEPLGFEQSDVRLRGHAIEARLYAEDPAQGYAPQTGVAVAWEPASVGRTDHGMRSGQAITSHYDPMVAKVIASGRDRDEARRKLSAALRDTVLLGLRHNKAFLLQMLDDATFRAGDVDTGYLASLEFEPAPPSSEAVAIAAALLVEEGRFSSTGWSNAHVPMARLRLRDDQDAEYPLVVSGSSERRQVSAVGSEDAHSVRVLERDGARVRVEVDGRRETVFAARDGDALHLDHRGQLSSLAISVPRGREQAAAGSDGTIRAPSGGTVISVAVTPGARVEAGAVVVALEAMKIESAVLTPVAGTVSEVRAAVGERVEAKSVLVLIEPDPPAADASEESPS
jgi:geranyl-CoA carboxylase alpha subunit